MALGSFDFRNISNMPFDNVCPPAEPPTLELANGEDFNGTGVTGLGGLLGGALGQMTNQASAFGAQFGQQSLQQTQTQMNNIQLQQNHERHKLNVQREQMRMQHTLTMPAYGFSTPRFKSPVTNRTDNSLVSYIAAPFWLMAWVLTFGKFGKLLYNLK